MKTFPNFEDRTDRVAADFAERVVSLCSMSDEAKAHARRWARRFFELNRVLVSAETRCVRLVGEKSFVEIAEYERGKFVVSSLVNGSRVTLWDVGVYGTAKATLAAYLDAIALSMMESSNGG